jgi:hypothetical protein
MRVAAYQAPYLPFGSLETGPIVTPAVQRPAW